MLRLADRLVYGDQAVPYEALADLSRRLADSASPDELPERVAESAGRAVGAERTRVLLGAPGDAASVVATACWPDPSQDSGRSPSVEIPVLDRGEQVGSIAVVMPPGRALRPAERQLLDDFAAQAGIAFRNAMLQTELAARVREVDLRSKDLLASRRRLVGAEDEERERLAGAIQRRVVPHLSPVVDELSGETDVHSPSLPRTLEQLIAQTEGALEELRTVCRGCSRRSCSAAVSFPRCPPNSMPRTRPPPWRSINRSPDGWTRRSRPLPTCSASKWRRPCRR